jgi:pimeloyl-ACP methyl ester carboxylesterase
VKTNIYTGLQCDGVFSLSLCVDVSIDDFRVQVDRNVQSNAAEPFPAAYASRLGLAQRSDSDRRARCGESICHGEEALPVARAQMYTERPIDISNDSDTLGSVVESQHVVLIHGTGCTGQFWSHVAPEFQRRGYIVHTPSLRHHDLPLKEGSSKIAGLSLLDYTDDLVKYVDSLNSPPLLVGHSLGGLLAQLVAARTNHAGVIAAAPAPAAGIFATYPAMIRMWAPHFIHPRPWARPLNPKWSHMRWGAQHQTEDHLRELFDMMVCESGRAYCEMSLFFLDRHRAAKVDFDAITSPVLVIGAGHDRGVNPRIARTTARRHRNATYIEIPNADHLVFDGEFLPTTMNHIDDWITTHDPFGCPTLTA